MTKLKPCPFCGGEAKLKTARKSDGQISYDSIYVACLNCRSTGLSYTTYYNMSSNPEEEAIAAWNRRADTENKPLTRCENCTHWDKSISFMMSAHACSYWSPSKRSPRYTEGFEFCSFASAKPERSEG